MDRHFVTATLSIQVSPNQSVQLMNISQHELKKISTGQKKGIINFYKMPYTLETALLLYMPLTERDL